MAVVDTLVSTRLGPGVDPIIEADRRGGIVAIIRIGKNDLHAVAAGALRGTAPWGHPPTSPAKGQEVTSTKSL